MMEVRGKEKEGMLPSVLKLCRKTTGKLVWLETTLTFTFHFALQKTFKKGQWQTPREG